jgi:hypothetical protein
MYHCCGHRVRPTLTRASTRQLWLDNEARMTGLSSFTHRLATTLSGWTNAFLGQTLSRARLNAVASYDQSNELFMVRPYTPYLAIATHTRP